MRIKVVGESDCAKSLRGLLRKAGFAVVEYLPNDAVRTMPSGGYVVHIEEGPSGEQLYLDSVDCELEANILRHVTALSKGPVVVDRPGGQVHSDREIRMVVAAGAPEQALAVEFGVLRALIDTLGNALVPRATVPRPPRPWYQRWFPFLAVVLLVSAGAHPVSNSGIEPITGVRHQLAKSDLVPESRHQLVMSGFAQAPVPQPDNLPFATSRYRKLLPGLRYQVPISEQAKNALAPPLSPEDRLAIRDLQYQQDKLVIQLKDIELQRADVNKKIAEIRSQIEEQAYNAAVRLQVDVKKYVLDLDTLTWVLRAAQETKDEKQ